MGFEENVNRLEIVDIQFCYKNAKLLKALRDRGTCIKRNDWNGLRRVNERLDQIKTEDF